MFKVPNKNIIASLLFLLACMGAQGLSADSQYPSNDEDTILIERKPSTKIPYSKILRKFGQYFFKIDTETLTSFGAGKNTSVVRHYSQYLERSRTRIKLNSEEIKIKFALNF